MKTKMSKNALESALSRCYDACERKALESIVQFSFQKDKLTLTSKGSFTYYEEVIEPVDSDEDCVFCLRTSTVLDFVKYASTDVLFVVYDPEKKSVLISSSNKKTKIALQCVETLVEQINALNYDMVVDIENSQEFLHKLMFASKFCSLNFQDHPLTAIHCKVDLEGFNIKSTNGPMFYSTKVKANAHQVAEIYIPKKSPQIFKNIFAEFSIKKIHISNRSIMLDSGYYTLTVFVEKSEKDSFPEHIIEFLTKSSEASLKVSSNDLMKSLKFFYGTFPEGVVKMTSKDGELFIESKENNIAARESITVEESNGAASGTYSSKLFVDCLDSMQTPWVNIDFVTLKEGYYLAWMIQGETLILLCPTTS